MKTEEEVIKGFLNRNCNFPNDSKVRNRIKSQLKGVWRNGFEHGNEHVITRMKVEHGVGYEEGYKNGYKDGQKTPVTPEMGFEDGYDNGYNNGYDSGYNDGLKKGRGQISDYKWHPENAYQKGYEDGLEKGERKHKTAVEEIFILSEEKKKEEYDRGYKDGYKDGSEQCGAYQRGHDEGFSQGRATAEADKNIAYQEGMEAVWKALTFWYNHDDDKRMKEFLNFKNMKDIVLNYPPVELIDRIDAYKEEQKKIKVGDEVKHKDTGRTFVVTKAGDWLDGFNERGEQFAEKAAECWEKTGRHFDEVEQLLNAIKSI